MPPAFFLTIGAGCGIVCGTWQYGRALYTYAGCDHDGSVVVATLFLTFWSMCGLIPECGDLPHAARLERE